VDDLIVTVFKLAVNVNILNIKTGEMLEYLVIRPTLDVLHALNDYKFKFGAIHVN
jgi:hypothetical protein